MNDERGIVYAHNGYILIQNIYNWHFIIQKDGKTISHAQYHKKLSENEAQKKIDIFVNVISKFDLSQQVK